MLVHKSVNTLKHGFVTKSCHMWTWHITLMCHFRVDITDGRRRKSQGKNKKEQKRKRSINYVPIPRLMPIYCWVYASSVLVVTSGWNSSRLGRFTGITLEFSCLKRPRIGFICLPTRISNLCRRRPLLPVETLRVLQVHPKLTWSFDFPQSHCNSFMHWPANKKIHAHSISGFSSGFNSTRLHQLPIWIKLKCWGFRKRRNDLGTASRLLN